MDHIQSVEGETAWEILTGALGKDENNDMGSATMPRPYLVGVKEELLLDW